MQNGGICLVLRPEGQKGFQSACYILVQVLSCAHAGWDWSGLQEWSWSCGVELPVYCGGVQICLATCFYFSMILAYFLVFGFMEYDEIVFNQ